MHPKTEESLDRLIPRLKSYVARKRKSEWSLIEKRVRDQFPDIFHYMYQLFGDRYDFFYFLEEALTATIDAYNERPQDLRNLDKTRENDPFWYKSHKQIGAMGYADLFADDLKSLHDRIPYLKELGITYFHLMPFFECPDSQNDGGYAVSDYRTVRKDLGTMTQLESFASALRKEGISLCADFVFNHTSDEHTWAEKAKNGEERYQKFYHMYDDRTEPDMYDQTLREIFPDVRRGNFTWVEEAQKWVWTTFHNYQWDLNYENPDLFVHILKEMLFMANAGIEVFRLDAIAFTGKEMGTTSENRPRAHYLVRALNKLINIAAPSAVFKSEAIVHPDFVNTYISTDECELSYNPLLMALMWEALATRNVNLLEHSLLHRFNIPDGTSWVNYVRSHDDIGWTFSDEDAMELGIHGENHRKFLNRYYAGEFPGSFARGESFQHNPDTGDMRICGMAASLTGIEKGLQENDENECELAIKRTTLMYAVTMFIGGIPLIYLGDELAVLNDHSYKENPDKKDDSRWVHRVKLQDTSIENRKKDGTREQMMFSRVQKMAGLRKSRPVFGKSPTTFHKTDNRFLFTFERGAIAAEKILFIGNFSEHSTEFDQRYLAIAFTVCSELTDLWSGRSFNAGKSLKLDPYQFVLLTEE